MVTTNEQEIRKENQQLKAIFRDCQARMINKKFENQSFKEEVEKLKKELKEKELLIEHLNAKLQETELMEKTHIAAFEVSERWNKGQKAELSKENRDKENRLKASDKIIADKDTRINSLGQELRETRKRLEVAEQVILDKDLRNNNLTKENKELKDSYFNIKTLPGLPKKQNGAKQLGKKIKTSFQKLIEKKKHQAQELIAKIEVKK